MIGPNEAFVVGCAAGAFSAIAYGWLARLERDRAVRDRQASVWRAAEIDIEAKRMELFQRSAARFSRAPDPQRSAAGRAGAAVTNAKRRSAAELHRQRVLEVAEQMRRDMAAKKGEPNQ